MKISSRILGLLILFVLLFSGCSSIDNTQSPVSEELASKRVLFCGDSITWGVLGSSYLKLLAEQFPDYELVNLGLDGDTVSGIRNRTITHLQQDEAYDLIVISAGHNDILLPAFMNQGPAYRLIVKSKEKQGSIPAGDFIEFITIYGDFIDSVRAITSAPIVLATLSVLNEKLEASTNQQRLIYNQGIRELVADKDIGLADTGSLFDERLRDIECRDFLMSNLFESVLFDRSRSKTDMGAEKLSRKRLLHLTIDGAHLNPEGAMIYSSLLTPFLENL